jgi:hypothetical protein
MMHTGFERRNGSALYTRRDVIRAAGGVLAAGMFVRPAQAATFSLLASATPAAPYGGSNAVSPAVDSTGADLVLYIQTYRPGTTNNITGTDSKGNAAAAWHSVGPYTLGTNGAGVILWYLQGGSVGTGHTITTNGSNGFGTAFLYAFSGSAATPLDQNNGATAAATSVSPSLTPTQTNELVIAVFCSDPSSIGTCTNSQSGMTLLNAVNSVQFTSWGGAVAYQIQTSAAAVSPTFSATGAARNLAALIVSFKSTSSAAGGSTPAVRHQVRSN